MDTMSPLEADADMLSTPPPKRAVTKTTVPRSTVADTWRWMWKDSLGRVVPFALAAALSAKFSADGPHAIGLTRESLGREVAVGLALGVPMLGAAIGFRAWDAPRYRLPTVADQTLQSAFYFGLNAPAEELFWRGTVQNLTIRGLRRVPRIAAAAAPLGWALTTAAFGAYHRLGNWRWRSIAGVTAAGGAFGAMYLHSRHKSLIAPIIIHGFATAGYLSWGDMALNAVQSLRRRRVGRVRG